MAGISKRVLKSGDITWRVQFRRVGIKSFATVFNTREEAREFADKYEKEYCLDPENFQWDRLRKKREREFNKS